MHQLGGHHHRVGLHRRILRFRAFFMSQSIDVDCAAAINVLAGYGLDGLQKSGFSAGLVERLDNLWRGRRAISRGGMQV
jgi:hypothetical protein